MTAAVKAVKRPAKKKDKKLPAGHRHNDAQMVTARGTKTTPAAMGPTVPKTSPPQGSKTGPGHGVLAAQSSSAGAAQLPVGHPNADTQPPRADGTTTSPPTIEVPVPIPSASAGTKQPVEAVPLADPMLGLLADTLDDLERTRIANENRYRQLTRNGLDADGLNRGFGLTEDHPDVARLAELVKAIGQLEHDAALNMRRRLRAHPLGSWVKATAGVGEKQGARLLASIADPYWHSLYDRPRTVSELWAFCGLHVLPANQLCRDAQGGPVGGAKPGGDTDHHGYGTQGFIVGVAPTRARGQKANWNATAKMRAYLVAEACMKCRHSPYRDVYDEARAKYVDAVHKVECRRCGPKGKPALPGSPISAGHQHARALRLVMKTVLRDLWRESKRIHEETA